MQFKERYIEAFEGMYELIKTRIISKDGYKIMTSAINEKDFVCEKYWVEANMINMAVLGMTAKNFQELNNIDNKNTRDGVIQEKLNDLDIAQRVNAKLIKSGTLFNERKDIINRMFKENN